MRDAVLFFRFPQGDEGRFLFKREREVRILDVVGRDDAHEFVAIRSRAAFEFGFDHGKARFSFSVSFENVGNRIRDALNVGCGVVVRVQGDLFQHRFHRLTENKCEAPYGVFVVLHGLFVGEIEFF